MCMPGWYREILSILRTSVRRGKKGHPVVTQHRPESVVSPPGMRCYARYVLEAQAHLLAVIPMICSRSCIFAGPRSCYRLLFLQSRKERHPSRIPPGRMLRQLQARPSALSTIAHAASEVVIGSCGARARIAFRRRSLSSGPPVLLEAEGQTCVSAPSRQAQRRE